MTDVMTLQAEMWIGDKKKALDAEKAGSDVTSLEEKIKKLQKHQAFQAELTANQPRIAEIKDKGETDLRQAGGDEGRTNERDAKFSLYCVNQIMLCPYLCAHVCSHDGPIGLCSPVCLSVPPLNTGVGVTVCH